MNGSKSTFKRKGYWLTAFAAAVLLAASPGTAQAQVEITGPSDDMVNEGGTATYTVKVEGYAAADADEANVVVTLTDPLMPDIGTAATTGEAEDVSLNLNTSSVLTFSVPENTSTTAARMFSASQTIRVATTQDPDAEDEVFEIDFTLTNDGGLDTTAMGGTDIALDDPPTALTIKDNETQTYALALSPGNQKPTEGTAVTVALTADPTHEDGSGTLTLNIDKSGAGWSLTLGGDSNPVIIGVGGITAAIGETVTIANPANDKNRVADTVTLSAHSGRAGDSTLEDSLVITLADNHALQAVTAMVVDEDGEEVDPQPTSVEEGETVKIAVMVLNEDGEVTTADEDLEITLMPAGSADTRDYRSLADIKITSGQKASTPVDLIVETDEDVGMEMLVFDATVSGEDGNGPGTRMSAGVLSLGIEDATAKKIAPKASEADYATLMAAIAAGGGDDGVNPGDTITVTTSDLFTVTDGYTASYGVSVEGDSASASASGDAVTINALMAGEAKITVTGTARMVSSSLIPTQTVSNVAELTFPVMVVDTTLVVTLSADPMEVEAGGTTMITATANRAVTAGDGAVTVHLVVVGDGMLDADSITIAMGAMSGSATLTANESVTVVATGSGVTGLMQVAVTVTAAPEPEPVPALPLIAQLLLGLGLLGGGARHLYRRRQG